MDHVLKTLPAWATLAGYLAACASAAATGALFPAGAWYAGLRKPR